MDTITLNTHEHVILLLLIAGEAMVESIGVVVQGTNTTIRYSAVPHAGAGTKYDTYW